ncbi:hypothetical protein CJ030_MR3G026358 [Morella rubra]|uniref:Malectin-like domain-containing protein n=1 Tax=Morella rubra TaxID=262757 RepID=A0A6A1W417_9ROSI|nr:hypothetical protein CJ030_MR3G026358 [Morella rubra]
MAVSVSKPWLLFILVIAILAVNSKLAVGDHRRTRRELAADIPGFITLSCGLPANSSFEEETSGIRYISDVTFVDTGISRSLPLEIKGNMKQYVWYLRSFPEGIRNCYTINNITYQIFESTEITWRRQITRIRCIGASLKFQVRSVPSELYRCLVNKKTPFILELQQYVRFASLRSYEYDDDANDRVWWPYNNDKWTELSTNLSIDNGAIGNYNPPSIVMSTAATPKDDSAPLEFSWEQYDDESGYYNLYMYFAEVVRLEANQSRSFMIEASNTDYGPYEFDYLTAGLSYDFEPLSYGSGRTKSFSIFKTENSTLPPIINAFEIYSAKYFTQSETHKEDVDAITKIKSMYGIKRNWQGDPCAPKEYFWEGLNCSYDDSNPPRITSLNLSSSGLMGAISDDISNLVMLQILYPDDAYDRFWDPYEQDSWTKLSTDLSIKNQADDDYNPPSIVMSTAATPKDDSAPLEFSWEQYDDESGYYYMYMYFAEVDKPTSPDHLQSQLQHRRGPYELDNLTQLLLRFETPKIRIRKDEEFFDIQN